MEVITPDIIVGNFGSAVVLVSSSKDIGFKYNKETSSLEAILSDGTPYRIEIGRPLRAKVMEFSIELETQMKIICKLDVTVLESVQQGGYLKPQQ